MTPEPLAQKKLEKLLEHGRANVWNPEYSVDWDAGMEELEKLPRAQREALRAVLSLVYYSDSQGKQILETLCRSLDRGEKSIFLSDQAHEFFVQQMDDEARHAAGLEILFKQLGLEPEPKALSHIFYSKILLADGLFDMKLVLIYWYIEIIAKTIFVELKRRFPETCIDSLFTRIIRDEARHVGFGEIYIPAHVRQSQRVSFGQMTFAYYSSAAALPGLFRFGHYSRSARRLGLNLGEMFSSGMAEIASKVRRLPEDKSLFDLRRPAEWMAALL